MMKGVTLGAMATLTKRPSHGTWSPRGHVFSARKSKTWPRGKIPFVRTDEGCVAMAPKILRITKKHCTRLLYVSCISHYVSPMLHFFKFRQDLFDPQAAKDVYTKRPAGKGWPEECPPIRAANGFGFDLLANFDVTFVQTRGQWRVQKEIVIPSDFDWAAEEGADGVPLTQQYAWFWEKGQKLPHEISDNVYSQISHQVKVSSFLFLKTDANELLYMTDIPNMTRPWRAMSALIDTDWYPASYPWHVVLELDRRVKKIVIKKGEPLCRVIPVRRDTYFAQEMSPAGFDEFFTRGQKWLATHGQQREESVDITRTYVKQQVKSKFVVMK